MQIPSGAIVKYSGVWPRIHGDWWCGVICQPTVASLVSRIGGNLAAWGLTVLSSDFEDSINPFTDTFSVGLSLRVEGAGFGSEKDVVSIVRGEVHNIIGDFPLADSIVTIQPPNQAPIATGQPDNSPIGALASGDFGAILKELSSNTQLVVVGLGLGIVTALILMARPQRA